MDVKVPVFVKFRRVVKGAQGQPPGKGHLTVNGFSLCEGDGRWLQTYTTEDITVEEFLRNSCSRCLKKLDG
jgi:hypothetical protein